MSDAVKKIQELLKLPQKLCKMCGSCCFIATFKKGLSYEEILELISDPETDPIQVDGAKDFLSVFEPYYSHEEMKKIAPEFYEQVMTQLKNPNTTFFRCKYVSKEGACLIHEDRPFLCRIYPVPHERTMFFPGCGFEEQCKINWKKIMEIVEEVRKRSEQTS